MLPSDIAPLMTHLVGEQGAILGPQLLSVYLRGSLVLGDFDPHTSDQVQVLSVNEQPHLNLGV